MLAGHADVLQRVAAGRVTVYQHHVGRGLRDGGRQVHVRRHFGHHMHARRGQRLPQRRRASFAIVEQHDLEHEIPL